MSLWDHQGKKALVYLKARRAYKPGASSGQTSSPQPIESTRKSPDWDSWAENAFSRRGGLLDSTATQKTEGKRDRSSNLRSRRHFFTENWRRGRKIGNWPIAPGSPGENQATSIPEKLVALFFRVAQLLFRAHHSAKAKFVDWSLSVSWQMFCSTVSHSARNAWIF